MMNPEEVVNYKIFLCAVGYEPEIRRLAIDKSVANNYFYLKQKLINIFPTLKEVPFTISWKDREGDNIRICTDEELVIALQEMESDFKKIYVSTTPQQEQEGPVHPDITCDGCERPVRGFRYKCMVCIDYDLCADCERSQRHSDHPMVRIPLPITQDMPFGRRFARDMHKISKHIDHFVNGFGRRWEKCEKKRSGMWPGGESRGRGGCPHNFAQFVNSFESKPEGGASSQEPTSALSQEQTPEKPHSPPERFAPSKAKTDRQQGHRADFSDPNISEEQRKFVEILKNGLALVLDPLEGEDLYTVHPMGGVRREPPQGDSSGEDKENKGNNNGNGSAAPMEAGPAGVVVQSPPPESPKMMEVDTPPSPPKADKEEKEKEVSFVDGWSFIGANSQGGTGDATTHEIIVLSPEVSPKEDAKPAPPLYPNLVMPEAAPAPPEAPNRTRWQRLLDALQGRTVGVESNPSVDWTVAHLMQMGFNNDGGWLQQLVEAKQGDINEILKFLQPIPKSTNGKP